MRRRRIGAWSLEAVLGHCTFAALCCRGLLSVFHSVYAFVERGRASGKPESLWDECRAELRVFRSLMIFLTSDWLRGWNDLVVQTDSSLEGHAVAQAHWPVRAVAEVGRTSERQRFRRVGSHRARESALEIAGFRQRADGSWAVTGAEASLAPLRSRSRRRGREGADPRGDAGLGD